MFGMKWERDRAFHEMHRERSLGIAILQSLECRVSGLLVLLFQSAEVGGLIFQQGNQTMVDMERVITLDELVESVPEDLIRQAELQRIEQQRNTASSKQQAASKGTNEMSKDISKAQRIRNYLAAHPEARNRDVVEALQEYSVTAADVANVKSISKRNGESAAERPAARDAVRSRAESTAIAAPGASITLPELEAGVAFVKAAGSIMRAKHLLIIIEQIKAC